MIMLAESESLLHFHERLVTVMSAVAAVQKYHRGRPLEVKRAYLEQLFPEAAPLAMLALENKIGELYQQIAHDVEAMPVQRMHDVVSAEHWQNP